MNDTMTLLDGSLVQHGPASDRVYLMKWGEDSGNGLPKQLHALARKEGYGKIIAKVPEDKAALLEGHGYVREAAIPDCLPDGTGWAFMSRFLDPGRSRIHKTQHLESILEKALESSNRYMLPKLPERAVLRPLGPEDAQDMVQVFRKVFDSYPFPVYDPDYLRKTMAEHILYFGIEVDGRLAAVASCETDPAGGTVEMTDFAVLPEFRGKGFALLLLFRMEREMRLLGFRTLYTIARAGSYGMNIAFARMGYSYGGRLANNTQIGGQIESMNIWHKTLEKLPEK